VSLCISYYTFADSSEYKMCLTCRVRYQKYGIAKRARWKAKREQASLEVAATVTTNEDADLESMPIYSDGATDESPKEGDKDQNSTPGSSNSRVSTDASEKTGNPCPALISVGAHIAVDDIVPVRDGGGGENAVEDYHQHQAEDGENEGCYVETIRGKARTICQHCQLPPNSHFNKILRQQIRLHLILLLCC